MHNFFFYAEHFSAFVVHHVTRLASFQMFFFGIIDTIFFLFFEDPVPGLPGQHDGVDPQPDHERQDQDLKLEEK